MNFTTQIESTIKNIKEKLTIQQLTAFAAVLIAGLCAHGYVFFNRISYHDNSADIFALGGTYESGRWALGFIYDIQMLTSKLFAVPVFNGLLSVIFIAIAAMLVVDMFKIKSRVFSAYIGIIMVVYPVVTSIFSFMFTAWEYFLALLLSVVAARSLYKGLTVKNFVISVVALTFSLGLYQAFMAFTIAALLFKLYLDVVNRQVEDVITYIKHGFIYLAEILLSLGLWAVMKKLTQAIKGISAVAYKGMDEGYDLSQFPAKLIGSIKAFFGFGQAGINAVLYLRAFTALIVIIGIVQIFWLLFTSRQKMGVKLISLVGLALLPIAMNVVYILSTSSDYKVDSLMVYGDIFVFIIPAVLIEIFEFTHGNSTALTKWLGVATWLQLACLFVMLVGYIYLDNAAYLKGEIAVEQATAYFTELAANIKSTEGFSDDMEIVFVGCDYLDDGTNAKIDKIDQFEAIQLEKYPRFTDIITYGGSIYFMQEHVGFGSDTLSYDDGTLAADPQVQAMPTYPNDGAIAIIDGKVIVKLGEE